MTQRDLRDLLETAFECTIYVSPKDLWLTYDELMEIGSQAGFLEGEVRDTVSQIAAMYIGGRQKRLALISTGPLWGMFGVSDEPDFRNYAALDFVYAELNLRIRQLGQGRYQMERSVLVERGVSSGIAAHDMESAITLLLVTGHLAEKDGLIGYKGGGARTPLPSEQKSNMPHVRHKPIRQRAYDLVRDVVARRTDARASQADALDAFSDALTGLGLGNFRLWWTQTVSELRQTDVRSSPVSALVLAAALVEGALAFVVKHARAKDIGPFKSSDFAGEPRSWKIDDLVKSATTGQSNAIFDTDIRNRVQSLIKARQRIHAGRMLSEFPQGITDLRPEEAADAKLVASLAVRRVLDWLHLHP